MRVGRTMPALLMLLLVTAGLFTMHTLGHFTAPHTGAPGHGASVALAHDADPGQTAAVAVVVVGEAGDGAQAVRLAQQVRPDVATTDPSDAPAMPMGGVVACVAILCALTVLAIGAVLRIRTRMRGAGLPHLASVVMDAVRGPPKIRIGLTIADLAVLRN